MSDAERRILARKAGDGDLAAAIRLVELLKREAGASPSIPDFIEANSLSARAKSVLYRLHAGTWSEKKKILTVRDLASLSVQDLVRGVRGCGMHTALGIRRALSERAGLDMRMESIPGSWEGS